MFRQRQSGRQDAAGFSLIEMLVASAIFAIAAAVAFILYSAAQKSYKAGENFTDQQQSTRVAFDRMISDIRLAGFNTNPDGDASRVDEQVEGAWDTAVTIRGDFDFEDPVASTTPEAALAGIQYNVVSTGNDEIVTYVLAKPGPVGPDSLTLRLDADKPRSKSVSTITIPNVVLVQNNPPYTLYRVTLTDVAGPFPASPQAATNFVYEPVAENIRSMTFLYYDDGGNLLNPNTPASAADDIGGADANITTRGKIRRIAVSVVGMTPDPDQDYTDPTDATATSHYRKFDLTSDVNPENLGKTGIKDIDITPPPTPTNISVVAGHCQGILVKWDQPAPTSGVTSYVVKSYPSGSPNNFSTRSFTYPHLDYGVLDYLGHGFVSGLAMGSNYCFQVQARDLAGNQSAWAPSTAQPCAVVTNTTTPGTPQNVTATYYNSTTGMPAALDGKVQLNWDELKVNTVASSIGADPNSIGGATILRDMAGYKVYRDVTSAFSAPVVVKTPTDVPVGVLTTTDAVAACKDYFYTVAAVDQCGTEGAQSAMVTGRANTQYSPAAPTGLSAARDTQNTIRLQWTGVTTNTATPPQTIAIDKYKVYRALGAIGLSPSDPSLTYAYDADAYPTGTPLTYEDNIISIKNNLKTQAAYYQMTAVDYCPHESQKSSGVQATCSFSGSLVVSPASGSGGGDITLSMSVVGGTDLSYQGHTHITRNTDGFGPADYSFYPPVNGSPSTVTWPAQANDTGVYTIYWEVENDKGCIASTTTTYTRTNNLPCKLTAAGAALSPSSGNPKTNKLNLTLSNTYSKALTINQITTGWTGGASTLNEVDLPTSPILTTFCLPAGVNPTACTQLFGSPPTIGVSSSAGCQFVWNASVAAQSFTLTYGFTDTSGITGTCTFCVNSSMTISTSTTGSCP